MRVFELLLFPRVMPLFQFSPFPTVLISNQSHPIIYWWISKINSSKESCCEIEYEAYNNIHMWRISIVFFAYFNGFFLGFFLNGYKMVKMIFFLNVILFFLYVGAIRFKFSPKENGSEMIQNVYFQKLSKII